MLSSEWMSIVQLFLFISNKISMQHNISENKKRLEIYKLILFLKSISMVILELFSSQEDVFEEINFRKASCQPHSVNYAKTLGQFSKSLLPDKKFRCDLLYCISKFNLAQKSYFHSMNNYSKYGIQIQINSKYGRMRSTLKTVYHK